MALVRQHCERSQQVMRDCQWPIAGPSTRGTSMPASIHVVQYDDLYRPDGDGRWPIASGLQVLLQSVARRIMAPMATQIPPPVATSNSPT